MKFLKVMKLQKFLWTLFSVVFCGSIFIWIEKQYFFAGLSYFEWLTAIIFFIVIFLFLNFAFSLLNELQVQKLRNQPSWVYYLAIGFALGPIVISLILLLYFIFENKMPIDVLYPLSFRQIVFNILFSFILTLFLIFLPKKKINKDYRFASGAVGIDSDGLNFRDSANNVAIGLQKINKYISVVGLYGGLGFGKSSYARMIIESLDPCKTLYTYISLTETNEAKDFSKLFAERWLGTLKERYPKIDTALALPLMQSVLRESGNGWIATLFSIIPGLNLGLIRTKAKYFDEFYKPKNIQNTTRDVARIFGNVPEIFEDLWVVIVDEIERAQFDEIYRLVEIIERFKSECRTGTPIKIMFILCISNSEFEKLLNTFKDSDPRAYLIKQFFFEDPKSITQPLFLPPVQTGVKKDFIVNQLKKLSQYNKTDVLDNLDDVFPDNYTDTTKDFLGDEKKALSYMFGLFGTESPRVILRCIQGVNYFYEAFKNKTNEEAKTTIRLSDLLAIEYIKIRYPYLVIFFERTIHFLLADYNEVGNDMTVEGLTSYFMKQRFKENKFSIVDWIKEITGVAITDTEKSTVEKMVGLVAFAYFDYTGNSYNTKKNDLYYDSLSLPKNLYDYLSVVSDAVTTSFDRYNQIYLKHKNSKLNFSELSVEELIGYSRFLSNIYNSTINFHTELVSEMAKRILDKKIIISPKNINDTVMDDFIYQFIFQITTITEKDRASKGSASDDLKLAYSKFKDVLLSPNITIGAKFILLNSLANNTRGSGSEIHSKLENAFIKIQQYWPDVLKAIAKQVFEEFTTKYFSTSEIIYDNEENFFYTMYQGWSGKASSTEEIRKIREVAERGLEKHPDAISLYWVRYKINDEWKDFNDVLAGDTFFGHETNFELYMPLKKLIEITDKIENKDDDIIKKLNFWKKISDDEKYNAFAVIKDDQTTLKAVLISRGLLQV